MTAKQMVKAVFDPNDASYFSLMEGEEQIFWAAPCRGETIWQGAWRFRPRHKALYWLVKLIFVRKVLPYLLVFGPILLAVLGLVHR